MGCCGARLSWGKALPAARGAMPKSLYQSFYHCASSPSGHVFCFPSFWWWWQEDGAATACPSMLACHAGGVGGRMQRDFLATSVISGAGAGEGRAGPWDIHPSAAPCGQPRASTGRWQLAGGCTPPGSPTFQPGLSLQSRLREPDFGSLCPASSEPGSLRTGAD